MCAQCTYAYIRMEGFKIGFMSPITEWLLNLKCRIHITVHINALVFTCRIFVYARYIKGSKRHNGVAPQKFVRTDNKYEYLL